MKLLILLLIVSTTYAQNYYRFFINNINIPLDNKGTLADVYEIPEGSGGEYKEIPFLFSGGFWLSGYSGDTLWANGQSSSSRITNYVPGKAGEDPNDPRNKDICC